MTSSAKPVLHADFFILNPNAGPGARQELIAAAQILAEMDNVLSAVAIECDDASDFDLALLFVLPEFRALEPFGTNQRYTRFLQGSVAPVLQGLAGADVQLESDFAPVSEFAACLALAAPPETYDWEVRGLLNDWADGLGLVPDNHVCGLAIGERQRFRGLAVTSCPAEFFAPRPAQGTFGVSLIQGRARQL